MTCPAGSELLAHVAGPRPEVVAHLADCTTCRGLVDELARTSELRGDVEPIPDEPAGPAVVIGRFVILDIVSTTASGIVYAAYDPTLQRKIALHVLRPELVGDEAARDQLLREARAIARVRHPNVMPIYDVGTARDGAVFVAMELASGSTLAEWLTTAPAPRDRLAVLAQIARGLAAAHRAGVTHGDLRVEHVRVGPDARPRIGAWAFRGSERDDQRAFSAMALAALEPPTGVPARAMRALRRGADGEPFASVDALARELGAPRGRSTALAIGAGALAVAALGVTLVVMHGRGDAATVCSGARDRLAGVWDPARRAEVVAALHKVARPDSSGADGLVVADLDRYADRWIGMHDQTCEAANVRQELSAQLLDLRMACLQERLYDLRELADRLAHANRKTAERAATAVGALPALEACSDDAALQALIKPPADPATQARLASVRVAIARVRTLRDTGDVKGAIALGRETVRTARALGYQPALAEALRTQGVLEGKYAGDGKQAETLLAEAATAAEAGGDDTDKARALADLVMVVGAIQRRPEDAQRLVPEAEAAIKRAHGALEAEVNLRNNLGNLLQLEGKLDEAAAAYRRAIELASSDGAESPALAATLNNLGNVYAALGRYDDALPALTRSLAIREKRFGPSHPEVARTLQNLSVLHYGQQKLDIARKELERAVAIIEATAPNGPELPALWNNLSAIANDQGDADAALRFAERAVATSTAAVGADDPTTARLTINLGDSLARKGRTAEAIAALAGAVATLERTKGADHPWTADATEMYAETLLGAGRARDALPLLERTLRTRSGPNGNPVQLAHTKLATAHALIASHGDRKRAIELAEAALATFAPLDSEKANAEQARKFLASARSGR